jgi:hypothetical protein
MDSDAFRKSNCNAKVEFNARRRRPGWIAWGNEAPSELENDAEPRQAIVRSVHAAPVLDDEIIDLPNILRRGDDNVAPWMNTGAGVCFP